MSDSLNGTVLLGSAVIALVLCALGLTQQAKVRGISLLVRLWHDGNGFKRSCAKRAAMTKRRRASFASARNIGTGQGDSAARLMAWPAAGVLGGTVRCCRLRGGQ
ncbi:MAG: hypothetical protein ACR5K7_01610 [Symbiopectobacterium sp.]